MARRKRKVPAINGSSMADISFLMLIYFLLTSSMDTDSGLARRLPPPPQDVEHKEKVDVQRRNLMVVLVNFKDEVMVRTQSSTEWYYSVDDLVGRGRLVSLKDKIKEFVLNTGNREDLPEVTEQEFAAPIGLVPVTGAHVISLQNDATTSYKMYITVQNELVRAYNELRQDAAKKYFNMDYSELTEEQQKLIGEVFPQRISEAEPKNYEK